MHHIKVFIIFPYFSHVSKVPNLLLLRPKNLNLKSWIDYKTDCFNVAFPRSLMKNGMYYFSSQIHSDRGTFRATEAEKPVDEGGMRSGMT